MNKTLYIWLLIFLALPLMAYADGLIVQANNVTTFQSDFYAQGVITDVTYAQTTITASNGTVLVNGAAMYHISTGTYGYNFTPPALGNYDRKTTYLYNGNLYDSSEDFLVVNNINDISHDTVNVLNMAFETIILFLIGLLLAWAAKYLDIMWLYFFSGTWFIVMSSYLIFTGFANYSYTFFTLLGFGIIIFGVQEINKRDKFEKEKKFEEVND